MILKDRKDLTLSNIKWNCTDIDCIVSFTIENRLSDSLLINISLRAYKEEYVGGSDALATKIVGERIIKDELHSYEIKQYKESLRTASKKVSLLNVNAWSQ